MSLLGLIVLPSVISNTAIPSASQMTVAKKYMNNFVCLQSTLATNPFCLIEKIQIDSAVMIRITFTNLKWIKSSVDDNIIFRITHLLSTGPSLYTDPIVITTIPKAIEVSIFIKYFN